MVQKMRSLIQLTQKVVTKMNNQKSAERNGSIGGSSSTVQINEDNKIRNKGAISIIENGDKLISLDLSNNEIGSEICEDLKKLLPKQDNIMDLLFSGQNFCFGNPLD